MERGSGPRLDAPELRAVEWPPVLLIAGSASIWVIFDRPVVRGVVEGLWSQPYYTFLTEDKVGSFWLAPRVNVLTV